MSYQRRSDVPKLHPEPLDHYQAKLRIKEILEKLGYFVFCYPEEHTPKDAKLNINFKMINFSYTKTFDIFATKVFPKTGLKSNLIVEVDGIDTRHGKPYQQKKDRFAQKVAEAIIDNLEFVRIDKDFVNDDNTTDEDIMKALRLDFYIKYKEVL